VRLLAREPELFDGTRTVIWKDLLCYCYPFHLGLQIHSVGFSTVHSIGTRNPLDPALHRWNTTINNACASGRINRYSSVIVVRFYLDRLIGCCISTEGSIPSQDGVFTEALLAFLDPSWTSGSLVSIVEMLAWQRQFLSLLIAVQSRQVNNACASDGEIDDRLAVVEITVLAKMKRRTDK
jgi:hypothetical protein